MDFIEAVINNNVEIVKEMLQQNAALPKLFLDDDKVSPLHFAAQHNSLEAANLLILAGADVHALTHYTQETPLDIARLHGHSSMIDLLSKATSKIAKCC